MKRLFSDFVAGFIICMLVVIINVTGKDSMAANEKQVKNEENGLTLSDRQVKITSGEHTATFWLYDTVAAKQFYNQLPLQSDLTNFRDAQWMFYPPEKLNVTAREAYHDGKKGELSYYEPWGDVFMLYKDFYASDEMLRLGIRDRGDKKNVG